MSWWWNNTLEQSTPYKRKTAEKQPVQPQLKHVFFAWDYDGCAATLFKKQLTESERIRQVRFRDSYKFHAANADVKHLYVASFRQDQSINKHNMQKNQNGDCFKNYASFCKAEKWVFQTLLYADVVNRQPAGTAMRCQELRSRLDEPLKKTRIINEQLKEISKNFPNQKLDYYFYEDRPEVIIDAFMNYNWDIPENITVHLIHTESLSNEEGEVFRDIILPHRTEYQRACYKNHYFNLCDISKDIKEQLAKEVQKKEDNKPLCQCISGFFVSQEYIEALSNIEELQDIRSQVKILKSRVLTLDWERLREDDQRFLELDNRLNELIELQNDHIRSPLVSKPYN